MQRIVKMLLVLAIVLVAAACGSDEEEPLPTMIEMATSVEETEAGAQDDPTPTPETSDPAATPQPEATATAEGTDGADESTDAPQSEEVAAEDLTTLLPPIFGEGGLPGNNNMPSGLPFTEPGLGEWQVSSETPAPVYECPDVECEVIDNLEDGTPLEVILINDLWLTILLDNRQVFVQAEFATNTATDAVNLPPLPDQGAGALPDFGAQMTQSPQPPITDGAMPDGIIVTTTPGIDFPSILATAAAESANNTDE